MLDKLQKKWKVNGVQLALILCTFAIGGSLTGYIGRKLMPFFGIESKILWLVVYILLITIIWPMAVVVVSVFFGQYKFFSAYLKKMGLRMGLVKHPMVPPPVPAKKEEPMKSIAIMASGKGSNAQNIIDYFHSQTEKRIMVGLLISNNPMAGLNAIAEKEHIPLLSISKESFAGGKILVEYLKNYNIDLIVLAGFLLKVPASVIHFFPDKIINIHPALLPLHGGKGMYGHHVHEAVLNKKETQSGITIHYVDEAYDHGRFILQITCPVLETDTPELLAQRVKQLEHEHYPKTIEQLLQ